MLSTLILGLILLPMMGWISCIILCGSYSDEVDQNHDDNKYTNNTDDDDDAS